VQDDGLSGGDVAAGGEVTDSGGRDFRVVSEVEIFDGGGLFESCLADASGDRGGVAAGDLVLTQALEELEVSEFPGLRLAEPDVQGVEHAGQLQGPQRGFDGGRGS